MTIRAYAGVPLSFPDLRYGPIEIAPSHLRRLAMVIGPALKISRLRLRGDRGLMLIEAQIYTTLLGSADAQGNVCAFIPLDPEGIVWRFPAIVAPEQCQIAFTIHNQTDKVLRLIEGVWWGVPEKQGFWR